MQCSVRSPLSETAILYFILAITVQFAPDRLDKGWFVSSGKGGASMTCDEDFNLASGRPFAPRHPDKRFSSLDSIEEIVAVPP
jgi:hypothetical protein